MRKYAEDIRSGFTLIEAIIVLAITMTLGAAITGILISGGASWHSGDTQIQVNQEARKGMSAMIKELRNTRPLGTIINVPADGNFYSTVTFRVPNDNDGDGDVIDSLGNIEWSSPIIYSVANNQLMRTIDGISTVLANNVNSVTFRRQTTSTDRIDIALQTQKTTVESRVISATFNCSVKMRN